MKTQEQLREEYAQKCSIAGDLWHQKKKIDADLERLEIELRRLDQLYMDLIKQPPEPTEHEATAPKVEDTKTP